MKYMVVSVAAIFLVTACQPKALTSANEAQTQSVNASQVSQTNKQNTSIRDIDFQNFTYPWTKNFGSREKPFTLTGGKTAGSTDETLSLSLLAYIDVTDEYEDEAIVVVTIESGNASNEILYIYALEAGKPKLLESFEFGFEGDSLGTAFDAHGELVIERYLEKGGDAECCPSIVEISHFKWQTDKFVRQGEPQQLRNSYVERTRKSRG